MGVFGGFGLIDGDGFFAVGGEEGDGGGFSAVFVGLEVDADFVAAGLFDAEGEAGAGGFVAAVAVVFADVGLEAFAVGPFAGELGFGVVDDDAFELFGVDAVGGGGGGFGEFFGVGGEVEIPFEGVAAHGAGLGHEVFEDVEVLLIDATGGGVVANADPSGLSDDLAHHAAGAHDAGGAEGVALDGDGAAGHEEIADVLAVEAAVGDGVAVFAVGVLAEFGAGDEGIVGEVFGVLLFGIVQILVPGGGDAAVGVDDAFDHVFAIEDHVSDDAAGFAGAADVGEPGEVEVGVFVGLEGFEGGDGSVNGAEVVVADEFEVVEGVLVEAAFPEPLAVDVVLGGGCGGVAEVVAFHVFGVLFADGGEGFGLGEVFEGEGEGPGGGGPGDGVLQILHDPHVAHAHAAFFFHHELGSGEGADAAVAGAVDEELAEEAGFFAGLGVEADDGADVLFVGGHFDAVNVGVEVKGDGFLGVDGVFLELVIELLGIGGGAVAGAVGELFNDLAEVGVEAAAGAAHGPDLDFAGAVAAEDGAVLDEGDFEALACAGDGGAHAGVAAADDDEIVLGGLGGFFGEAEELAAELVGGGEVGGRGEVFAVFGEDEGIDAAIEAGEVVEGEGGFAAGDFDGGGFFPLPVFAGGAEGVVELLAVDADFEAAGGAGGIEGGDPVFGAGPESVVASGEIDGGGGVFDGLAHAVGHEVGGAHDIDELGVEDPAAGGGEGFGLEPEGLRVGRSGGAEGEEGGEEGGFHGWGRF